MSLEKGIFISEEKLLTGLEKMGERKSRGRRWWKKVRFFGIFNNCGLGNKGWKMEGLAMEYFRMNWVEEKRAWTIMEGREIVLALHVQNNNDLSRSLG